MIHTFLMPEMILSGDDVIVKGIEQLPESLEKAFIVTAKCNVELGFIEPFTKILEKTGRDWYIYDGVNNEPTDEMVGQGAELCRREACDFLIAIGGGSVLDVMKAIGLILSNSGEIADYMGTGTAIEKPPFMVAVPTTAGTGSEATQFTIITDTKRDIKMLIGAKELIPDLVLLHPEFTMTAPANVTVSSGLDALIHAIEAFLSKKAQPLTDTFALSAIQRIFQYLPEVLKDSSDKEARKQMSYAALEAGIAFNNSSVTLIHGMSRPIGALFHVPHGLANAMLLEECMAFMADSSYQRLEIMAETIKAADSRKEKRENAERFLSRVKELCTVCKVPALREYGIDREEFLNLTDKMAEDALASGSPQNLRKSVKKSDIIRIYKKLWENA